MTLNGIGGTRGILECIYYVLASLAILVAGVWALRRYRREHPFESNLTLKLSASAVTIDPNTVLVHVELTYTNTGKAYFEVERTIKAPATDPKRTFLKVFAVKSEVSNYGGKPKLIDWNDDRFAELVYDGWFPDIPKIVQEPGETEIAAIDLLINSNIKVINAWVKIYEDCEYPYFWSTSNVFSIENLLSKNRKIA